MINDNRHQNSKSFMNQKTQGLERLIKRKNDEKWYGKLDENWMWSCCLLNTF